MEQDDFVGTILDLYRNQNWSKILEVRENFKEEIVTKLLWVWPSVENLIFIADKAREFNQEGILSIGCGCGLFEWLLQQSTGVSVIGYEVNEEWWNSRYSSPQFIELVYPDLPPKTGSLPNDYALLFCYFNNERGFLQYLEVYKGKLIFIIGPGKGRGTHTNPEPFRPNLDRNRWQLNSFQEIKTTKDYVAVYSRVDSFL